MCGILQVCPQRRLVNVRLDLLVSCQLAWEMVVDYAASRVQTKRSSRIVRVETNGFQRRVCDRVRGLQDLRGPRIAAVVVLTAVRMIIQCWCTPTAKTAVIWMGELRSLETHNW